MILTPLQKSLKNGEDWGKLIVAKGFKKLPNLVTLLTASCSGHTKSKLLSHGNSQSCFLNGPFPVSIFLYFRPFNTVDSG